MVIPWRNNFKKKNLFSILKLVKLLWVKVSLDHTVIQWPRSQVKIAHGRMWLKIFLLVFSVLLAFPVTCHFVLDDI